MIDMNKVSPATTPVSSCSGSCAGCMCHQPDADGMPVCQPTIEAIPSLGSVRCGETVVPAGTINLSQVVNLTPHPINIEETAGKVRLVRKDLGELAGLPAPVPGKGVASRRRQGLDAPAWRRSRQGFRTPSEAGLSP